MLTITLVHLAPDLSHAQADLGSTTYGDVDEDYLLAALESFRGIDPLQNTAAEPHLVIESSATKLLVRTGQGRLFVYNARDLSEPFVELDPAGVLRLLSRSVTASGLEAADAAPAVAAAAPPSRHSALAVIIITLAVILNGYTIYSFFHVRPVRPPPEFTLVTDAAKADSLRTAAAGRYATGNEPGDRILEITADGHVRFLRVTSAGRRTLGEDAFRVAERNDHTCLVTAAKGIIDIRDIYTVVYFRDVYHRR
ncbi:MAG TPA: hypothetical protein VHE13_10620 [Opitutus sp.]|nr:hypothetical protein [Opitutus sp.]